MKPSRWVPLAAMVALFCAGAFFAPSTRIEVAARRCEALAHDGEPWIVPAKRIRGYCGPGAEQELQPGSRTGTFHSVRDDDLRQIDPQFWDRLDKTFPCNLAAFSPGSVHPRAAGGMDIALTRQTVGDRSYVSGDIATKDEPDARFTYGRFEVVMKPPKNSGVITAFFLYRFDPWQEIDAEFLGKDPTKILLNVYYNPGEEGDLYNYGLLGTPVLVDLGFDASEDFHTYAIEWEASEIRWFADGQLIHVRKAGAPTPIPHLPMRLHANLWPCCSEQLAGPFEPGSQPIIAAFKSISVARWYPSPLPEFLSRFDLRVTSGDPADWRQGAKWMQPDRGAD